MSSNIPPRLSMSPYIGIFRCRCPTNNDTSSHVERCRPMVITDMESFQRDHPDQYELQMAEVDTFANIYVNTTNQCSQMKAHLYNRHERPNCRRPYAPIVLERIAIMRSVLSSTPTKYGVSPIMRLLCCCCPGTDHVKNCFPVPLQDTVAFTRDHPMEKERCVDDLLTFFNAYNACTTEAEKEALVQPHTEKLTRLLVFGEYMEYCHRCPSHNNDDEDDTADDDDDDDDDDDNDDDSSNEADAPPSAE